MTNHQPSQLGAPLPEQHDPWVPVFLRSLFAAFSAAGIRHCVLRNYEDFPMLRDASADLDVLIEPRSFPSAWQVLRATVANHGLRIITHYVALGGAPAVTFVAAATGPALHLDLFDRIAWKQFDLADANILLNEVVGTDPPHPCPAHEAAMLILSSLAHRGSMKDSAKARVRELLQADRGDFVDLLTEAWGIQKAQEIFNAATAGKWPELTQMVSGGKRLMVTRQVLQHPWRIGARSLSMLGSALHRIRQPPGFSVVLLGPDGCGKSTLGLALRTKLVSVFSWEKTLQIHWRPMVLPPPRLLFKRRHAGEPRSDDLDPHKRPAYSRPVSFGRFFYFWLDFLIGVPLKVLPVLSHNGLVLIDRYFYDFYVDPLRYRLAIPQWVFKMAGSLVAKPDLILVLDAPDTVLLTRKQELSADEISRQRAQFLALARAFDRRCLVVNTDQPIGQLAEELRAVVFERLANRTQKVLP
jgi:hypothetical protein